MSTSHARRVHTLAQAATARAHQLADGWEHAAPRRPLNGHRADCPDRLTGPARRCRHCIADILGAEPRPEPARAPTARNAEVRACHRCYAPTTDPERHC